MKMAMVLSTEDSYSSRAVSALEAIPTSSRETPLQSMTVGDLTELEVSESSERLALSKVPTQHFKAYDELSPPR